MTRNRSLPILLVTAVIASPPALANRMVTDTKSAINSIRHGVIKKAKKDRKDMHKPSLLIKGGMVLFGYDAETRSVAMIARPFFLTQDMDASLQKIGSIPEDIAYLQSVFTEFQRSGRRTLFQLITILHNHMMAELGLNKTLEKFKKMMEKTDHHNRPRKLNAKQFETYCRCVARGLFAVYWFEHGQK